MKWIIENEIFVDAWEAAGRIAESMSGEHDGDTGDYAGAGGIIDTSGIFNQLEQMHDNEESEVNGYRVISYLVYE